MESTHRRIHFPRRKRKPKYFELREEELGTPPGTLLEPEVPRAEKVNISVVDYTPDTITEFETTDMADVKKYRDTDSVTWINIDGVDDVDTLKKLGEYFGVHPLALEDIQDTDQRPKFEEYDDFYLIVVKDMAMEGEGTLVSEQISILLGKKYVITVQLWPGASLDPVRTRLRENLGRIRSSGPDYLAYAILDIITDESYPILETYGDRLEKLEEKIVRDPRPKDLQRIQQTKRNLLALRRSVWPNREVIGKLRSDTAVQVTADTKRYLRDCYDHTIQIIDMTETYRDMTSGLQDLYMSSISNRMNEVMKVLTIIATIFIPLTFITGVYGMNFSNMPELGSEHGYLLIWLVMIFVMVVQLAYFKHRRWI